MNVIVKINMSMINKLANHVISFVKLVKMLLHLVKSAQLDIIKILIMVYVKFVIVIVLLARMELLTMFVLVVKLQKYYHL